MYIYTHIYAHLRLRFIFEVWNSSHGVYPMKCPWNMYETCMKQGIWNNICNGCETGMKRIRQVWNRYDTGMRQQMQWVWRGMKQIWNGAADKKYKTRYETGFKTRGMKQAWNGYTQFACSYLSNMCLVYIYIYIYIYIYTHTLIHTHTHQCVNVPMHMHLYAPTYNQKAIPQRINEYR